MYASVVGTLDVVSLLEMEEVVGGGDRRERVGGGSSRQASHEVVVVPEGGKSYPSDLVPSVGCVVLGRVARVAHNQAFVEIVAAEGIGGGGGKRGVGNVSGFGALPEPHYGSVRKEDVRSGASEEVVMSESFRPGDVVMCRIVSPGDSRRYGLSTAENELGVIRAKSASGGDLVPVSWREMECSTTGNKEKRKVAKPREGGKE